MPFLKKKKYSFIEQKIQNSKRYGWRCTIFSANKQFKDKYIGQWKDDKKTGVGLNIKSNDFLYQGEWLNGMRHGFGILRKISENNLFETLYAGYWFEGKKQGFGLYWYCHSFYKGCFLNNKRHGFGQMWWNDGRYYEGFWEDNMFHGNGLLLLRNGNQYKGKFTYGKKNGIGKYYHKNTGQIQNGFWNNDVCISSIIQDSYIRQFANNPTPYIVPVL